MRHATAAALDGIDHLLAAIRRCPQLKERKRGTFYRSAAAWLHLHEDSAGLFADLKIDGNWTRFSVNSKADHAALLVRLADALAD